MKKYLVLVSTGLGLVGSLNAAEITGKVALTGTPPPQKEITAASADPSCGKLRTEPALTRTYVVSKDGGLANVVVYLKAGLSGKTFTAPEEPILIDQKGCMYEPYVSAAMVGQKINIRNSDALMHNVNAGTPKNNKGFNFSQVTAGQVNPRSFENPELGIKLICNVPSWMVSYVSILDNPYFAVSDKDGNFVIKGDLPDGKYTFEAFHQKAGATSQEIEVKGGKATVNFTLEVKQ
jgi:hypothetical protein